MWVEVACVVAVLVVANVLYQCWDNRNRPPPRVRIPLIGDMMTMITQPVNWHSDRIRKYGGRARAQLWGRNIFLTGVPEDLKRIFAAEEKEVLTWAPGFVHKLEGQALTMLTGPRHSVLRKELFSLFTTKAQRSYFPSMHYFVLKEVQTLARSLGTDITMMPILRRMSFSVVYGSMIDMEIAEDTEPIELYEAWIQAFSSIPLEWVPSSWGYPKGLRALELLKRHVSELLDNARASMTAKSEGRAPVGKDGGVVTEMLLQMQRDLVERGGEDGVVMSDGDLVDNLLLFLVAGHETVLSSMCTLMRVLAQHPEIIEKARAEVKAVCPNVEEPLTYDDVSSLPYISAVVKEVLRILPPVSFGIREVIKPLQLGPYTVPPGELVMIGYETCHEAAFKDFQVVAPERFYAKSPEYDTTYKNDDRKAFSTFSGGTRSCVGMKFALMETEMYLAELLRHDLTWTLTPGQDLTIVQDGISVKHASGVQVKFAKIA
eukprot:TRINITY_DN9466_c0_g1_i1.p1 TRINITY_DN9466_c0_g1~~TRINITY_DN9466_c0_g1_i1.p1  ORF type:complete len:507 (-),score=97.25 TRINITY_DN9466_c0_g1_i1:68-1531(-)